MSSNLIPKPVEFLLSIPLYTKICFTGIQTWEIIDLLYYDGTYDSFCNKCHRDSTFQVMAPEKPSHLVRNLKRENLIKHSGGSAEIPQLSKDVYRVHAKCTRKNFHTQDFLFLIDHIVVNDDKNLPSGKLTIEKIGQHPSYGDLHLAQIKRFKHILGESQLGELNRAIGLASHDVGIGAYVYLRRVFESLVEETHQEAKAQHDWDENIYNQSRMSEKITLLKAHLPTFLVQHPEMYSLLSRGIHELSEKDCLTHFETLRIGIELILDEKLQQRERTKKINEAKAALTKALGSTKA